EGALLGRRTAAQMAATRASLLEHAERLFGENGYAQTQIAQIAGAAGVGIGSFYRQFSDKEALLMVLLGDLFEGLRCELVQTRLHIEVRSPLEQLATIRKTYDAVFGVFIDRPNVTRAMLMTGSGASVEVQNFIWQAVDDLVVDMANDLARAEAHGMLVMDDKKSFADALIGMCMQVTRRILIEGSPTAEQAAALCTRMTLGAMVPYLTSDVAEVLVPLIRSDRASNALPTLDTAR
ncbi:MAG: AcrR family transcriptional regulator, partial [Kiritimatiellia bacterium]